VTISGVGVDIVEIKRFDDVLAKERYLLKKMFTKEEQQYCGGFKNASVHYASTFAAKEAACKALGGTHALSTFEIRRTKQGRPEIWSRRKKVNSLALSISHEGAYAVAVCIAL
jgi:holo-[acyl-carrier protein] synthase